MNWKVLVWTVPVSLFYGWLIYYLFGSLQAGVITTAVSLVFLTVLMSLLYVSTEEPEQPEDEDFSS